MNPLHQDFLAKPVHQPKDSLFSSSSGYTNYRGLINLCYTILFLSNFRVALENILKYGILVDPMRVIIDYFTIGNIIPTFYLLIILNAFILFAYIIELFLTKYFLKFSHLFTLIGSYVTILLTIPPIVFHCYEFNPIAGSSCCLYYTVVFLKLISYHMVNYWHRQYNVRSKKEDNNNLTSDGNNGEIQSSSSPLVEYPNNLTLWNLYYFIFAPTLCYELNFPRTKRIRKSFLIKRLLEIFFLVQIEIALIQQWMVPAIQNSLEPFMEMSYTKMLERLLKLAVPNHLCWLIFFYLVYHSYLNLLGEILCFADREFYKDWWNSDSIEYFWRTWNTPTHRWCVRHLYLPLVVSLKMNTVKASAIVFLASAFFHEYLVSVPLNMYRIWAFAGMAFQIPLALLVQRLPKKVANYAMWLSLIIGQPLCILMYYHDYYVIHVVNAVKQVSN
ncbi:diacylglycerol O-acyltransferase 1a-like protein [Euroglyphus maynei]|uniref:O-acyltransferase n=1 Tax=Euroglyphus maynei TaxID=6958 RepID=A0A1Y3AZC6_EURMA|nr:diacylglycerol O-acyltransferase 1a-like protein [Euroglyphus maynei]